jgi:hypothetical protein
VLISRVFRQKLSWNSPHPFYQIAEKSRHVSKKHLHCLPIPEGTAITIKGKKGKKRSWWK